MCNLVSFVTGFAFVENYCKNVMFIYVCLCAFVYVCVCVCVCACVCDNSETHSSMELLEKLEEFCNSLLNLHMVSSHM